MQSDYVSVKALEREIINTAEAKLGLISGDEERFIRKIANWPSHYRLTTAQANYLYSIGEKLGMVFDRPVREQPIDYKARACA
ncbi:MAG: hypothetical protein Q8L20_10930 [Gammaproteobacteria bacterium]|nr:hypothetical protein [Gammaproteobacteria bacterium]